MVKPLVYLAGPIGGCTWDAATDWRSAVTDLLAPDIEALSPMRGKEYLKAAVVNAGRLSAVSGEYDSVHPMSSDKGIVGRDRFDVTRCAVVFANLVAGDPQRASIGTMIEFGWADSHRKPIVAVMAPGNVHWHAMARELCTYVVPTIEEAVDLTRYLVNRLGGR